MTEFMNITGLIILLILIPQIYYWKQNHDYSTLNNGVKFFVRHEKVFDDHREIYLTNTDGHDIFVRIYEVENPKALVQIVHGMAEHSSNYLHFINFLVGQGYSVVAHDHRGHGRSISEKYKNGYMRLYEELIDDTYAVNRYMKYKNPDLPIYMVAHSMGSLVARNYIQKYDYTIDKLILSGTVVYRRFASLGVFLGNIFSFYLGEYKRSHLTALLPGGDGDISWISYDMDNVIEKQNDPQRIYNFLERGVVVIIALNNEMAQVRKFQMANPDLPIMSITGIDDIVTGGEKGLIDTFDRLQAVGYHDLTNIVYDGMKHEVLNEAANEMVYGDVIAFFEDKEIPDHH